MKRFPLVLTALAALSCPLFSGCVAAIGNHPPPKSTATLGQQLVDLQKARDAGAISEAEYQSQRAKFLR